MVLVLSLREIEKMLVGCCKGQWLGDIFCQVGIESEVGCFLADDTPRSGSDGLNEDPETKMFFNESECPTRSRGGFTQEAVTDQLVRKIPLARAHACNNKETLGRI